MLLFELIYPTSRWPGDGEKYLATKSVGRKKEEELDGKYFQYVFSDGYRARIRVEKMTAAEAREQMRKSKGFCNYEWMIESIIEHGEIR